jgi:geranylgeranyl pyrophosphate synthase
VLELVARHRGVEDAVRRAEEHVTRAGQALAPFQDGPARAALLSAARFAVARAS